MTPRPEAPDAARWTPRAVTTVLCDADGNLFPSEEPAFDASVEVTNQLLAMLGSSRRYDADELRRAAMGRNFHSIATDLADEHGARLAPEDLVGWVAKEATAVTTHLAGVLRPDPTTTAALERIARSHRMAVVSSSALRRLDACFLATGLDSLFPAEVRYSAQDSLETPTSKPDPAVYQHALAALGVSSTEAVAVEDAVAGVASAVAAGIPTVGNLVHVPASERAERAEQLMAAGAATVVDDWAHLADLLDGTDDEQPLTGHGALAR